MDYERFHRLINKNTDGKYDVTPMAFDAGVFGELIDAMLKPFGEYDIIAGIDALGFIFGGAAALKAQKPFLAIRKSLPTVDSHKSCAAFIDYSGVSKTLCINDDLLRPGMRVLIVDDWIETGENLRAAIGLIERAGAQVAGVSVIASDRNERTAWLFQKYEVAAFFPVGVVD